MTKSSTTQTVLEFCKEMERRSPQVPAELAPSFSQQHHKLVLIQARAEHRKFATFC